MESQETHPIYSFPKNQDEEVRLEVRKYKGKYYIDLRVWFKGESSEVYRPTKKGVIFGLDQYSELRKGVDRLAKAADRFHSKQEMEA